MSYGHVEKKRVLDGLLAAGFEPEAHIHRRRGWPSVLWERRLVVRFDEDRRFTIDRLETAPEANPRRFVAGDAVGRHSGRGWVEKTVAAILTKCEALS